MYHKIFIYHISFWYLSPISINHERILCMKENRENRRAFAEKVTASLNKNPCRMHEYSISEIETIFGTMLEQLINTTKEGKEQFFIGFGSFYLKKHKGHPVQFGSAETEIGDYVTLKFSASNNLSTKLRDDFRAGRAIPCIRGKK